MCQCANVLMGWISTGFFVGAGHALRVHGGFIFLFMMGFPPRIFVGEGHALNVHSGFIFYL